MKFTKLHFGTAGIPASTRGSSTDIGVAQVKKLGLDGMELEFVQDVYLTVDRAKEVAYVANKNGIALSCHASYYINLNSMEPEKVGASRTRIIKAAEIASIAGAFSVTFHPAFYMNQPPLTVYNQVKEQLTKINLELTKRGVKIRISPETTGKPTQFGTYGGTINLAKDLGDNSPCIDFSHLHARTGGQFNTEPEFRQVFEMMIKKLGRQSLDNMHMHISGIDYTPKGEKNHLMLNESDMNYKTVLKLLKEYQVKGLLICESPNSELDAVMLKQTYNTI